MESVSSWAQRRGLRYVGTYRPSLKRACLEAKDPGGKRGAMGHQDDALATSQDVVFVDKIRVKLFRVWMELSSKDKTQAKIKL